jgi:hypothetical protein
MAATIQPLAVAATLPGLTQALCAPREKALDLFSGVLVPQALSRLVRNCHCCRGKSFNSIHGARSSRQSG